MGYFILVIITLFVLGLEMSAKNRAKLLWFRLLGKNHNKNTDHEIQFGEMVVSAKGKSEIELPCVPKMIKVEFQDGPNTVPCDPHHDKVTWDITKFCGKHIFIIKWHVSGVREIKWVLFY